jgi:hypothetical protein
LSSIGDNEYNRLINNDGIVNNLYNLSENNNSAVDSSFEKKIESSVEYGFIPLLRAIDKATYNSSRTNQSINNTRCIKLAFRNRGSINSNSLTKESRNRCSRQVEPTSKPTSKEATSK